MHKNNCFDTARLIAALMVLITHHYALSGRPEPVFWGLESMGGIAVIIFFSISGFLISKSAMACSDYTEFMSKRLRRLIPALIPCAIFMYVIIGSFVNRDHLGDYLNIAVINNIIKTITLTSVLHDGITTGFIHGGINGSLWTLPLEFLCYLIAGCVLIFNKNRVYFLVVFILLLLVCVFITGNNTGVYFSVPSWLYPLRGLSFFLGAVMAMTFDRWNDFKVKAYILAALSLWMYSYSDGGLEYNILGYIVISFGTIALCTSIQDPLVKGRFDYSYGIYIYAFPVQQFVINVIGMSFFAGMITSIIATVTLAALSWHFVESRFLARKVEVKAFSPAL